MIDLNTYHPNILWEVKRTLEVFLKAGSITATLSRLPDKSVTAINILQDEGFCFLDMSTPEAAIIFDDEARVLKAEAIGAAEILKGKADSKEDKLLAAQAVDDAEDLKVGRFDRMDGGDQEGRFRAVPGKRLEAETLIGMIERKLKPKAKKN